MAVLDQSNERILSPSSPPPEKTCSGVRPSVGNATLVAGGESGCALRVVKKLPVIVIPGNLSADTKDFYHLAV
jgi:hypothetical protein